MIPHRKQAQALLTKRGRADQQRYIVEGVRLVEDALAAGTVIERLYHVDPEPGSRLSRLVSKASHHGIECAAVAEEELHALADTESPQGVVAVAEAREWTVSEVWNGADGRGVGDVVILDNVRDPGNVGTILRTAEAAGARGVVALAGTVELTNPKVVRSAMGAFFRLPARRASSADDVAMVCRSYGLPLVVTTSAADESVARIVGAGDVAFVLGSEAEGVDPGWTRLADRAVGIPMASSVESLNVAAAAAVVLFRGIWRRG